MSCSLIKLIRQLKVFTSLKNNSLHVPYRNSKLTHLLQDSLGGDAKTMIFMNVSPLEYNVRETISTLQFGQVFISLLDDKASRVNYKFNR